MNAPIKTSFERRIIFRSASIVIALASLALLRKAHAVVPPPDGGYPGFNTAEGQNALFSLTTGAANTAVGWFSLFGDTTASFNTGVGAGTLLFNNGDQNTAVGVAALLNNTTGRFNTATAVSALSGNTTGSFNTATGIGALLSNTTGNNNVANGYFALLNNTTGSNNTALGYAAGGNLTGDNNICIGFGVTGAAGESFTTRISNIWGQPGGTQAVYVDSEGRLGMNTSSRRFKEEIKPMDQASEVIYSLKPVSFRYKTEIEPTRLLSFGLIAEDVEQINTDLVLHGKDGKVSTVRYEAVNAMLLNEFLKEHRKNEEQGATIAQLRKDLAATAAQHQKQIEALTAGLHRVSAQIGATSPSEDGLELVKAVPQTASNNH